MLQDIYVHNLPTTGGQRFSLSSHIAFMPVRLDQFYDSSVRYQWDDCVHEMFTVQWTGNRYSTRLCKNQNSIAAI